MAAFGPGTNKSDSRHPSHRWNGDVLSLTQYDGDEPHTETIHPDADGFYALGARSWVWLEAGEHSAWQRGRVLFFPDRTKSASTAKG